MILILMCIGSIADDRNGTTPAVTTESAPLLSPATYLCFKRDDSHAGEIASIAFISLPFHPSNHRRNIKSSDSNKMNGAGGTATGNKIENE